MIEPSTNDCAIATPYRTFFCLYIAATIYLFWSPAGNTTETTDDTQTAPPSASPSVQISILDGKSFSGELGLSGEPALTTDLLAF